jgi:bacterioferritin
MGTADAADPDSAPKEIDAMSQTPQELDTARIVKLLNQIMEMELAGVVRYTHYSLMVYGFSRIPIVEWLRKEATESLAHAQQAGEMVTMLGGHPSLKIGSLLESHQHDIGTLLRESLEHEKTARALYYELLAAVQGRSVVLEEYTREMIRLEEMHADEVNKMLRTPGETGVFKG